MGRLDGRVALVTGGARGQGAAESTLFVAEGARVLIGDVLDEEGKSVAKELGENATYRHLDVTSEEQWRDAVDDAVTRWGRLDVLVNNAGIARMGPLEFTSLDDYMEVIRVNQVGVFVGMRSVVAAMRASGGGSIVNISSVDGLTGMANVVAYVASKFAVRGMTKVAAIEFGKDGIRVNSVHPGGIDTPMIRPPGFEEVDYDAMFQRLPVPRVGLPEEVARLVLFLASDDSSYCTGSEFTIDGGLLAGISLAPET